MWEATKEVVKEYADSIASLGTTTLILMGAGILIGIVLFILQDASPIKEIASVPQMVIRVISGNAFSRGYACWMFVLAYEAFLLGGLTAIGTALVVLLTGWLVRISEKEAPALSSLPSDWDI